MEKISSFATKNMALLVVAVAIIALVIPASLNWVPPRIPMLLGVIMFGMGMTLRVEDFKEIF
ncbi:MAG: bile acid:sodium symporter family protein, partial [Selenomonadaceae bacterium]|nr:bile acid:sodium symporter family protein [Selenomonadaceae bacterium]